VSSHSRNGFDWPAAHERVGRARIALRRIGTYTDEEARELLERRARDLARTAEEPPKPVKPLDVLLLDLAGERYAIEVDSVLEVVHTQSLTPVPCTPRFVLGLTTVRGRVLPVMDVARVLGLEYDDQDRQNSHVVLVEADGVTFGIAAGGVEGPERHDAAKLEADMVGVLDIHALVADRRLEVEE
jgi:purine-binding chemotaxis protein CheW